MPQDFPLEASETLAFTPASLENIPGAPVFTLRAANGRDKRFHRRLMIEEGLRTHSLTQIRQEVFNGLKAMWSPEAYEQHGPIIKEYWAERDSFELQKKDQPDLEWSYDKDIEAGIKDLTQRISEAWPPLRRMIADNAEYGETVSALLGAVIIISFTGLDVTPRIDRGYLTFETASKIEDALLAFEKANAEAYNLAVGTANIELFIACSQRMRLDEEEAKNSASPSLSPTIQVPSTEKISDKDGKSPAPARSKKIRENA